MRQTKRISVSEIISFTICLTTDTDSLTFILHVCLICEGKKRILFTHCLNIQKRSGEKEKFGEINGP